MSSGRAVPLATAAEQTQMCPWLLLAAAVPAESLDPGTPRLSCGTGWTAWHGLSRLSTCEASVDQTSSSLGSGLNSFVFVSCEVSWWLNTECSNKTQSNHLKAKVFFLPFSFLLSLSFLSWQGFLKVWMPLAFQNLTPHLQITENNGPLQFKICCLQAYFPSWSGSL